MSPSGFIDYCLQRPQELLLLAVLATITASYAVYMVYNLVFHPLAHIPGPWLARATYIPEFYYDVLRSGLYTKQIRSMHGRYGTLINLNVRIKLNHKGPIVRINPHEVHCSDRHFIDEIYAVGNRKRDKPLHQVRGSGVAEHATFSTTGHDEHRMRRGALAKYFSRAQVSRLEPTVRDMASQLCDKILRIGVKAPFDVTTAYSLFTTDVISGYCLGEALGLIAQEGWEPNFREPLYAQLRLVYWFRFIPFLKHAGVAMAMFTKRLSQDMNTLFNALVVDMPNYVRKAQNDVEKDVDTGTTVFGALLRSDLPPEEKALQRMTEEGFSLFAAGTETVSWALAVITYHLLTKPVLLDKVTVEVREALSTSGDVPTWTELEKLPYLSAIIFEGLRMSYGLATRTSRIPINEDLFYSGEWTSAGKETPVQVQYTIPRGYAIGMSSVITHHDETIFPDSHSFIPERWLDEKDQHRKDLHRSLLAFSKGSRGCIGISLAYCELYLLLSMLIVRVLPRMQLVETTEKDVTYDHDFFNPFPVWDSKGVRAIVI